MSNEDNRFYCYNPKLRKFLDQNGTRWVDKGIHYKTNRTYWVFERSARLGGLLERYKEDTSNSSNS